MEKLLGHWDTDLDWFVFIPEATNVDLDNLTRVLRAQGHPRLLEIFIYNPVPMPRRDKDSFPHPGAGFILSVKLVEALAAMPYNDWRR